MAMPAERKLPISRAACCGLFALWFLSSGAQMTRAEDVAISSAVVLQAKYADLGKQLESNAFGKPLVMESSDAGGTLRGSVYAALGHPFATFKEGLKQPDHWCEILILHLNTKYCRATALDGQTVLQVNIGRKSDQPVEKSSRVDFAFRVVDATQSRLAVVLDADKGPFNTRNYRIVLEAVPVGNGQTFMHLAYSYAYGAAAKIGLMAYLSTAGSRKVGFTVTGRRNNGEIAYVDGLRGLIERNTMRYFLAIEAWLGALSVPPQGRLEKRLADWYAAAERYPRQLHEIEREDYLDMKRREYQRQQSPL
ncbi:MAG TPA: hypothetical protein VHB46_05530 [Burkholderiales bacterium]|nr:hypothetical protein [Burkholderiales bacterium]